MVTEYGLYTPTDWNRECEKALERVMMGVAFNICRYFVSEEFDKLTKSCNCETE